MEVDLILNRGLEIVDFLFNLKKKCVRRSGIGGIFFCK